MRLPYPAQRAALTSSQAAGKLSVARSLVKILPHARVVPNHSLIDLAATLFDRDSPSYLPLRLELRRLAFEALRHDTASREVTWIFTDNREDEDGSRDVPPEYCAAARACDNAPFISVIIRCDDEEVARRMKSIERIEAAKGSTKLVGEEGVAIWREVCRGREIFVFAESEVDGQVTVDTTRQSAEEAARQIRDYLIDCGCSQLQDHGVAYFVSLHLLVSLSLVMETMQLQYRSPYPLC